MPGEGPGTRLGQQHRSEQFLKNRIIIPFNSTPLLKRFSFFNVVKKFLANWNSNDLEHIAR